MPPSSSRLTMASVNSLRKLNSIVLIDDDAINNFLNENLLKKLELSDTILTFKNGRDALEYLKIKNFTAESYPALILLDIEMPIMDGYEFLNALKTLNHPEEITIAVLSTSIRTPAKETLKASGIHHFITKPLTEDKMRELVKGLE